MKTVNDSMGIGLRNINVGKAECSVVLVPQGPQDHNILSRLLSEDFVVEPVTLTEDRSEIDGFEDRLKRNWVKAVRLAIRPKPKQENKPKVTPKSGAGSKTESKGS